MSTEHKVEDVDTVEDAPDTTVSIEVTERPDGSIIGECRAGTRRGAGDKQRVFQLRFTFPSSMSRRDIVVAALRGTSLRVAAQDELRKLSSSEFYGGPEIRDFNVLELVNRGANRAGGIATMKAKAERDGAIRSLRAMLDAGIPRKQVVMVGTGLLGLTPEGVELLLGA